MPSVGVKPGDLRLVALDGILQGARANVRALTLELPDGGGPLQATLGRGHGLWLRAPQGFGGEHTLRVIARTPGGETLEASLIVRAAGGAGGGCPPVRFSFDASGRGAERVVVAGSFNGWGGEGLANAWALEDPDGDSIWTLEREVAPGEYQYKFVLVMPGGEQVWEPDPSNPEQVPDGYDGFNSVLRVNEADCAGGVSLQLDQHSSGAGSFEATLSLQGGDGAIELDGLTVTLDGFSLRSADWSVDGNTLSLDVRGLDRGIHDLRVQVQDTAGNPSRLLLLKTHQEVSTDWRDATLYFAMTDRFFDGEPSNNEPIPGDVPEIAAYQGGDFAGLTAKIEAGYFTDLGVNAIWISWPVDNPGGSEEGWVPTSDRCNGDWGDPSYPTRQSRFSAYHGYWPADLERTEEHYGTLAELQELVDTAHEHGVRILLDFTANHVHMASPLYQEHQNDGTFHLPAEMCSDVGWDNAPVTCWFTDFLPDLNYSNAAARRAVIDMGLDWIRRSGADGFRFDAVKHLEKDFIRELRRRLRDEIELTGIDFYLVGETFTGDTGTIREFIGDDLVHGQFNFPLNLSILQAFAKHSKGLDELHRDFLTFDAAYGEGALMSNFLGNHDIARFISVAGEQLWCTDNWDNDRRRTSNPWEVVTNQGLGWVAPPGPPEEARAHGRLRLAFTYLMGLPGIPLIYYGDEFGLPGGGDPDNRRPMRFGGDLLPMEAETLHMLQALGQARASRAVLRTGRFGGSWSDSDGLLFSRVGDDGFAVVALNRRDSERTLEAATADLGIGYDGPLNDGAGGAGGESRDGRVRVTLPAWGAAILVPPEG